MKLVLTSIAAAVILSACSGAPSKVIDANYSVYVKTVSDQNKAKLKASGRPIFQLKGIAGQSISMSGVSEISVYAPANGGNENLAAVQPYVAPKNQFVEGIRAAGEVVAPWTGVASLWVGGKALTNLTNSVGGAAGQGYQYVQAPAANMTIGGHGVIGSGSFTESTLSGTGTMGAGDYSSLGGSGTLGSGAYNPTVTNTGGQGGLGGVGGTGGTGGSGTTTGGNGASGASGGNGGTGGAGTTGTVTN